MSLSADALVAVRPVVAVLNWLGVPHYLGGSAASSVYGVPRSTIDVDLVADLQPTHVVPFVSALESNYYVDANMIRSAIARKSSFNVIHLATMYKVDIFALKDRAFTREELSRIRETSIDPEVPADRLMMASPEDTLLTKLEWFRIGNEISERQWRDVLGILQVQAQALDKGYLDRWSAELGVADLLQRAWEEAGLSRS